MRLARRLGLSRQHQATALLHDATHSAFSHTLDYVLANAREDTHEQHAARLLTDSSLGNVLGRDGVARVVAAISVKPAWLRLLDAVDYTLRDLLRSGLIDQRSAHDVIRQLVTVDGEVCFATAESAWCFTLLTVTASRSLYADQIDLFLHSAL